MLDSELGFYLLEKMKNTSLNVDMSDVVEEAVNNGSTIQILVWKLVELNNGSTIQTLVSKLVELKATKKAQLMRNWRYLEPKKRKSKFLNTS